MIKDAEAFLQQFKASLASDITFVHTYVGTRVRRDFQSPPFSGDLSSPELPSEERYEWFALAEAIMSASGRIVMAELGAGYGRWMVIAAALAQRLNIPFKLIGVEAERGHFEMMLQHMRDNDINPEDHDLYRAAIGAQTGEVLFTQGHSREWWGQCVLPATDYGFGNWPATKVDTIPCLELRNIFSQFDVIDFVDMDVQNMEREIMEHDIDVLCEKVRIIHVATHSGQSEQSVSEVLSKRNWSCMQSFKCDSGYTIDGNYVYFQDGIQTWKNPKFEDL